MRKSQRGRLQAAALGGFAALLVAAGCSNGGDTSSETPSPAPRIAASDVNPVMRANLRDGGTMRWPIDQFPTQLNVFQLNGNKSAVADIVGALMPAMWRYDAKALPSPNPDYLTGAKLTATSPKQVVTYTLNPKATWSDGKPVTWKDFQAQFDALSAKGAAYQIASSTGYERIESVRAGENEREVVVTYARPFGDWQAVFDPLYPASTMGDAEVFNKGWLGKLPVTAGPFKLGSIDQAAKTITVVRDDAFWGRRSRLDRIVFRALERNAEIDAFRGDELTFVNVGTDAGAYEQASRKASAELRKAAAPDFSVITLNGTAPNLTDVNVRRAIAMGIDRSAIATSALREVEWPAVPMNNHFFVNTQAGYQNNAGALGRYNKQAAAKLLDQAGWTKGEQFREKAGKPLRLRWPIPSDSPRSKQIGRLVQDMLADIGVQVVTSSVPAEDYFDKYVTPGNFDLAPLAWAGTPFPVSSSRPLYAEPAKDADGNLVILQNFARVGSTTLDDKMDQAIAELDPAKARTLANQADRLIWQQVHSLPLYQQPQIRACDAKLANFGANGFQSIAYEDIGFTK